MPPPTPKEIELLADLKVAFEKENTTYKFR